MRRRWATGGHDGTHALDGDTGVGRGGAAGAGRTAPRALAAFQRELAGLGDAAALESLSAGQKAPLRTGPQNMARLKATLRALRAEVAKPAGAGPSR